MLLICDAVHEDHENGVISTVAQRTCQAIKQKKFEKFLVVFEI